MLGITRAILFAIVVLISTGVWVGIYILPDIVTLMLEMGGLIG